MLKIITIVKHFHSPSTYFIHCDLVDKEKNLFNGQPSNVLARFDIKGKEFEKVNYQSPQQRIFRQASTSALVNSLPISIRDKDKASQRVKARYNVLCENMVHRRGFKPRSP